MLLHVCCLLLLLLPFHPIAWNREVFIGGHLHVLYVCWKKNCRENVNIANFRRPAKEKSLTFSLFSRPKL